MNRTHLSAIALLAVTGVEADQAPRPASRPATPPPDPFPPAAPPAVPDAPEPPRAAQTPRRPRMCAIVGCERRATHLAGILLRRGDEDQGQIAYLDLIACPACRRRLQVRDVLTDAGWRKLEELGNARGFRPRRDLCRIQTVELERAPARFRDRYEE